jgi:hypothetical protein
MSERQEETADDSTGAMPKPCSPQLRLPELEAHTFDSVATRDHGSEYASSFRRFAFKPRQTT